jgi:hypothetical protein
MTPRRVSDWLRQAAMGEGPSYDDAVAMAETLLLAAPGLLRLVRNRLILGAFRYSRLGTARYDVAAGLVRRAEAFRATGNREYLVDLVGLALVEWVRPAHPGSHWAPADDGPHVPELP